VHKVKPDIGISYWCN